MASSLPKSMPLAKANPLARTNPRRRDHRFFLAPLALGVVFMGGAVLAHTKGLYNTKAEAQKRAQELGCQGTHQNNGLWMPCSHEGMLHKELREE